ncbi:hypothetical protein Busp01_25640 [Trinickia caryophylli]|uniref:Uncharacterized protein n=2 Tax=Trinickia caryophylli TaxID=28094 RepID=A0A1X7E376_TRICW|nr:hypothetical protein Busp01_25640 [Trinickia caryophylli]SMF26450.1 hypothetical protein SAMN06295900_104417 [Trinickia caryophylli]
MLTGCVTPYQHVGVTGGYIDKRVDDQTYHVQFSGNGYTSREMVHKYFMYRCAEVTQQQGFKYFMIIPPSLTGSLSTGKNLVAGTGFDRRFMQKTRTSAPVIIYSGGGGGITRWMNSGDIRMFNEDAVFTTKIAGWDASEVLEQLGPYVQSAGKTSAELPMAWVFEPGHPKVRAQDLLPTAPKKPAGSGT